MNCLRSFLRILLLCGGLYLIFCIGALAQLPHEVKPDGPTGISNAAAPGLEPVAVKSWNESRASIASGSCRIEELLPQVTARVEEFVENVNRISATEFLERERRNRDGKLQDKGQSKSNYVATIQGTKSGVFTVDEYRNETHGGSGPDDHIVVTGAAPALALIFHPSHVEEFAMTCEGLTDWRRHNTWRIHFEQRLDRPATMCGLQVGTRYFTVLFRGYAWIDKETFQIVHMETDLLRPIPELRLDMDHQSVDYRSVALSERDTSLWLPEVAEITVDFKGKRLVERHTFSNYRVFFVETGQRIGKPKDLSD